ncbi:hypothetical protein Tco_1562419 [Tanacetum coccineum]
MDQDTVHMVAASKVPMLKPENGNAPPITKLVEGVETIISPSTAEEKAQRRLELKARSTLLMGIPNEHQLKFNSIKDVKLLLQAIEKRFRRNAATKKTQGNFLKQQYEIFTTSSLEVLDQTFDSIQKLISQLEIHGESISQDDVNQKFLRMVKGTSSSSLNTQNVAFVSSNSTSSINGAVNTAHGVTTASTQATVVNSTTIDNLSDAMDLRWQMAMLIIRARRFLKNTGRKLIVNGTETIGFDKSKVECYNCYKRGHFARSDQAEEGPTNFALIAYSSTSSNSEIVDKCKTGLGYNVVPPPYTGNFMPPKPDLSFSGLEEFMNEPIVSESVVKKPIVETSEAKASADKPKAVKKNNGAPIIEDWVSNSQEDDVPQAKKEKKIVKSSFAKIEFVKSKEQVKSPRKTINHVNQNRRNTHTPRGNQRNWNNMMS